MSLRQLGTRLLGAPLDEREQLVNQFLDLFIHFWQKESIRREDVEKRVKEEEEEVPVEASFPEAAKPFARKSLFGHPYSNLITSIGNILSHNFQSDVHRIGCSMDGDEDIEPIKDYLLHGKGSKLLAVICKIVSLAGNGLFYNKDVANLLIELFTVIINCENSQVEGEENVLSNCLVNTEEDVDVEKCFKIASRLIPTESGLLTLQKVKMMVKSLNHRKKSRRTSRSERNDSESDLSEREDVVDLLVSGSHDVPPDKGPRRDVFHSLIRLIDSKDSASDSENAGENFDVLNVNERLRVMNVSVESNCYFIMKILSEFICYEQMLASCLGNSYSVINFPTISMTTLNVLPIALQSIPRHFQKNPSFIKLGKQLVLLIFTVSCNVSRYAVGIKELEKMEIISKLLEMVDIFKSIGDSFWVDTLLGVVYTLTSIAQYLPVTKEYSAIIQFIRTFIKSRNQSLVNELAELESTQTFVRVVDALSQLVIAIQRAKVLCTHRSHCSNRKHTRCDLTPYLYHHNDILGPQFTHSTTIKSPLCCVTSVTSILTGLLPKLNNPTAISCVVCCLNSWGFCCCSSYTKTMEDILNLLIRVDDPSIYKQGLEFLENMWKHRKRGCDCCRNEGEQLLSSADNSLNDASDSAFHSDTSLKGKGHGKGEDWCGTGVGYKKLLDSPDPLLKNLVVKHIWFLLQLDCDSIRNCLYQHLILPSFLSNEGSQECIEFSLTLLCLILSKIEIAQQFLNVGGFTHLCSLLTDSRNCNLAISAIETLLANEIKLINEGIINAAMEDKASSLTAFLNITSETTNECSASLRSMLRSLRSIEDSFESFQTEEYEPSIGPHKLGVELLCLVNLWRINFRLCQHCSLYPGFVKSSPHELVTAAYNFLVVTLSALNVQKAEVDASSCQSVMIDCQGLFKLLVDATELILPICLQLSPFILHSTEVIIREQEILALLRNHTMELKSVANEDNNLLPVLSAILGCSLKSRERERFKKFGFSNLYILKYKWSPGSREYETVVSSASSSDSVFSESCYDGDDEWCEVSRVRTYTDDSHGKKWPVICYGSLCHLVVELLAYFYESEDTEEAKCIYRQNVISCLSKILKYCRDNAANCYVLYDQNICCLLLNGFKGLLSVSQDELKDVQTVILDLFVEISIHKIEEKELKAFLNLFKQPAAPLDSLLRALTSIISSHRLEYPLKPLYCMTFPGDPMMSSLVEIDSDPAVSWIYKSKMEIVHDSSLIPCWSDAALVIPLPKQENPLASKCKTFSACLWFSSSQQTLDVKSDNRRANRSFVESKRSRASHRPREPERVASQVHVISFALDMVTVEIWLDTESRGFLFKIVSLLNGKPALIAEDERDSHLSFSGKWHLLCFQFNEVIHKKDSASLSITISVDGKSAGESLVLKHSCVIPKYPNAAAVLLGTTRTTSFTTRLGNVTLFRGQIPIESCFYLYCSGPDFCQFTSCQVEGRCPDQLQTMPVHVQGDKGLLEGCLKIIPRQILKSLQEELFFIYRADYLRSGLLYSHEVIAISNGHHARHLLPASYYNIRPSASDKPRSHCDQIKEVPVVKFAEVRHETNRGLHTALVDLGGVGVMLFLFAKTFEVSPSERLQAEALTCLLQVCEIHPQLMNSFVNDFNGFQMVNSVLETSKCSPSVDILSAYIRSCVSSPVFEEAVITSTTVFSSLFSVWKVWHKNESTCQLLYKMTAALLSDTNPFSSFNLEQMRRSHALQTILLMLQDIYVQTEDGSVQLSSSVAITVPQVISKLVGSPPDLALISDVTDCLLLLHKASDAYISHSRSCFYYLFTSNWTPSYYRPNIRSRKETCTSIGSVEDWEIISSGSEEQHARGQCVESLHLVMSEIVSVLGSIVKSSSEHIVPRIVGPIIRLEYLVVLAHNQNHLVREVVLKTLITCFKRTEDNEVFQQFLDQKGFHLLANQLRQYQATAGLLVSSLSLILETEMSALCSLEEINFVRDWTQLKPLHSSSFILLFSLIPNSAHDIQLFHYALQCLDRILEHIPYSSPLMKYLLENGVVECIANALIEAERSTWTFPGVEGDTNEGYDEDLQIEDIFNVLYTVAFNVFHSNGAPFLQTYQNICSLFSSLETKVRSSVVFRECSVIVFQAAFDCLTKHANEAKVQTKKTYNKILSGISGAEPLISLFLPQDYSFCNNDHITTDLADNSYETSDLLSGEIVVNKQSCLTANELIERLRLLINRVVDFIIFRDPGTSVCEREKYFARTVLHLLLKNLKTIIKYKSLSQKSLWSTLLWSARNLIRLKLSEILVFLLSSVQTHDERCYIALLLNQNIDMLSHILVANSNDICLVEAFLTDLIDSSETTIDDKSIFENILRLIQAFSKRKSLQIDSYKEEVSLWFKSAVEGRMHYMKSKENAEEAALSRLNPLAEKVVENAMRVTREVVEAQNKERRQFLHYLKEIRTQQYSTRKAWKSLIQSLNHEKGVWYDSEAFPQSWEMDPTEGPSRVRRRLRRCHLNIPSRFFMDGHKWKSRSPLSSLSFLFERNRLESDSSALIDRIHTNERIIYTSPCSIVAPDDECWGEVLIGNSCVHFVGERPSDLVIEVWMFEEITEVENRRYQLQNNAIEIFLNNGSNYLISFRSTTACEEFCRVLFSRNLPNLVEGKSLVAVTQLWRERGITNFEYLMYLNKSGGRSFNDLMQYPVFPFVLSDYESETLNLRNPACYRTLSRPMAVQKKNREQYYINQYNYLISEYDRSTEVMMPTIGPFHYGSHYSNSGTVLHFLVRMPPFTQMFLQYQDNNFDIPDRTFHSMHTTWRLASGESTTDFKELVPEFFFLPEFLTNGEKFLFGNRHNGIPVDDVGLPLWSREDARLFVLINRQALESQHVTEHLHEWIDLIFGYKQQGKAAVDALNVFHPATYYGVDVAKVEDSLKRNALQTMIKTFGQMPKQLFTTSHLTANSSSLVQPDEVRRVIGEVRGIRWGNYLGSPSESAPIIVWRREGFSRMGSLIPLKTNDVFGLPPESCLMLSYSRQKTGIFVNATYVTSAAIISWNHPDGVVRIRHHRDSPAVPFLSLNTTLDMITICATVPDYGLMLVGYKSGSIAAYTVEEPVKATSGLKKPVTWLRGHSGPITALIISSAFSVTISGGVDGNCILWDLNSFCYIRTIAEHEKPIDVIGVSETLGDVASASENEETEGSTLMVHTINGSLVGHFTTPLKITAACYSSAPEGVSVNVLVVGFVDGSVKMWSSWDLTLVRELRADRFERPVQCLAFSVDNHHLYVVNEKGSITIWGKSQSKKHVLSSDPITLF